MKKVLLAPDKFKGSLSAKEVCDAIAEGLGRKGGDFEFTFHPMADGGDGSLDILKDYLALKEVIVDTLNPLARPIRAKYFTSDDAAFIELASASGLVLLKKEERNPFLTSTLGTGILISDAISKGYQNIYLFLGGSATNDAGMGIAEALGFQFLDNQNNRLTPTGENLSKVATIKNKKLFNFSKIKITLFYDVVNPLFGKNGAAYVYAPQKGATPEQVRFLDEGLIHFSAILKRETGIDVSGISGGGSAGGIGAGLVPLCGAQMRKGFEVMAELTNLEENIKNADWVISGEGKLDKQSLQGKVIDGIAAFCQKHQKPLTLFVGKNELAKEDALALNVEAIYEISNIAKNEKEAMENGRFYLERLAETQS